MSDTPLYDPKTWALGRSRLKFMLGEFTFFSWRFGALLYKKHFTACVQSADEVRPHFSNVQSGVTAICMHSYALNAPQPRITFEADAIRYVIHQYRQHYILLRGSFEQYLGKFTSRERNKLKRTVRRFEEASEGALDFRIYTTPNQMPEFHRLALSISVKTYQHRLIDAGMPESPEFTRFLCDAAAAGRVMGFLLFVRGAPAAYEYCSVEPGGIVIGERTGFDPAHGRLAPGIVMQYLIIRHLLSATECRILDFSGGEARYKESFSTHSARCGDIVYFRRSVARTVAVCAHASLTTMNRGLARLLNTLQVKSRLKRYLRRSAEAPAYRASRKSKAPSAAEQPTAAPPLA